MARRAMVVWLVVGAVLMAGVVSGVGRQWPWRIAERGDLTVVAAVLGGWGVAYAVIAIFVVTDAIRLAKRRDLDGLQRAAHEVKTTAVWFFLSNFAALALLTLVAFAKVDYGYALAAPGLLAGATYLVLLPTSAYGIAALELMRREKAIGRGFFTVNMVLHLLFVVDVFSAVLVVEFARHLLGSTPVPKAWCRNLMTAVVGLCSALAVAGLVFAVITLILRPQDGALVTTTAALLLASPLALLLLVVIPVVPIVTLRAAVRLVLLGDLDTLQRTTTRLKLITIPMFVQNFILCTVVVLALTLFPLAASRGLIIFAGPLAVPIIGFFSSVGLVPTVVGTYLMMLVTSCYGIACLALLRRRRVITKRFCVVNVILHAGFVTDIVSTLVVAYRARAVGPSGRRRSPSAPDRSLTRGSV